jgi:hypothetical protein
MISNTFTGVAASGGLFGVAWADPTHPAHHAIPNAAVAANAAAAPAMMRKRRTAAATLASVNRGPC